MAYVDDALDAGLLHGLAGRRLVDVLVVLPPALPRTSCERAPRPEAYRSMVAGAATYLGEDHVSPVRRGDHEHLHLRRGAAEAAARVALVILLHPVRHAPAGGSKMVERQSKKRAPEQPTRKAEGTDPATRRNSLS
jgi:hypothetical protein